ncbi:HAMP domain-containing histidine kinase [Clostridium sp. YIM B02515]|uniref:histidine kinase n=1 Tax=Clostridium rhizosphaerae TaxID=2803861 RepID=A0ABS1TG87_9CLOT|nr:HAMP domain-containing sensor histidine kinase [Clostridium rhizosphaerae]MBL4937324.1 HAMP domain-containing histidine kinase [Clostridium rhizosphaerae]
MKIRTPKLIRILFSPLRKLLSPLRKLYNIIWNKVKKSIRAELVLIFGISLLVSTVAGAIVGSYFKNNVKNARIEYTTGSRQILHQGTSIADSITNGKYSINDKDKISRIIEVTKQQRNIKIVICDLDGKVLYKSNNSNESQVDIYNTIKNSMEYNRYINGFYSYDEQYSSGEIISFYPINFTDGRGYVIVSGTPEGQIEYYASGNEFPGVIAILAAFLLTFYFMTNKKMKYLESVSNGLLEISKGNLDYRIHKYGDDELASLAGNINTMAEELKNKIENERRVEKAKSELITNVSHDLRTPLTSIKGYLGLIKDKRYKEEEDLLQYVNIAYNKSEKLEVLINDLFEYTKLSNNQINMYRQNIVLNDLLEQLIDELVPICEENDAEITKEFINEKITVNIDANKTVRVFENLLMNAIRYSLKPGKIKVILNKEEDFSVINIQNNCDSISEEELDKIFDRFYRVDKSRSSDTGGSGLGLAIAKNIVELQGGSIEAKYKDGYISFEVRFKM